MRDLEPTAEPSGEDVTESIREKARELGYSEVGFARFDRRYIYKARQSDVRRGLPNAICLALEQEHSATQTLPSIEAEEAQGATYRRQADLVKELVAHINALGYRAQVSGPTWQFGPMIPMFVDAGLGQLGVNGQLLSPHFGSRARLQIIITDARVTYDRPVDYGIPKFCEICQVCFMRCPGRAIQGQRLWYRGVEKAKLIAKRCRPVMTRYSGCGVCMKTCPIQKYGMKPVMEHYIETGDVLGKGTENLEGLRVAGQGIFRGGQAPALRHRVLQHAYGTCGRPPDGRVAGKAAIGVGFGRRGCGVAEVPRAAEGRHEQASGCCGHGYGPGCVGAVGSSLSVFQFVSGAGNLKSGIGSQATISGFPPARE